MSEPAPQSQGLVVENWLNRASVIAGYLAALAGFVYLVGGVVMWLRFRTADLPPDQGVALMVFPELGISGYSIDDLLGQAALLDASETALETLVEAEAWTGPLGRCGVKPFLGAERCQRTAAFG